MRIHIALLRGVNVGGHKPVAMADLRGLLTRLGFLEPRSLLQSGNLVFRGNGPTGAALERLLEAEARAHLKLEADFIVRSAGEWTAIVADNPFPDQAVRDASRLVVMLLKAPPDASRVRALQSAISGPELVHAAGRHAYIIYPDGIGRSRLTHALIESRLGVRGTARNWNTVVKLEALAAQ